MQMKTRRSVLIGGASVIATLPLSHVFAAQFATVEQAQRSLFPDADQFKEHAVDLSTPQRTTIVKLAGPQPRHGVLRTWEVFKSGATAGYFFVDEVVGRQDLITYAVGVDEQGKLTPIEVLTYRESHGGEIRNPAWCAQFKGRDLNRLRFPTDIKNIAGATLSSEHVTQGARWCVALWQVALSPHTAERA
jgi:Na+-translocating ferredoxin:NAD+ oxidoreductase RnfG subunit